MSKPIRFKEANKNLLKPKNMTEEECGSLPVFCDGIYCISCWKLTLKERISIFVFGKIWLGVHSGKTQPPVWVDGKRTIFK